MLGKSIQISNSSRYNDKFFAFLFVLQALAVVGIGTANYDIFLQVRNTLAKRFSFTVSLKGGYCTSRLDFDIVFCDFHTALNFEQKIVPHKIL